MIKKNVKKYVFTRWENKQQTITKMSSIGETHPLVESNQMMYCFDAICKDIFRAGYVPTSADGLEFTGRRVNVIEFKSGFKENITTANYDKTKAQCEHMITAGCEDPICEDYWQKHKRVRKLEKNELYNSLHLKALETYATLEHFILPNCEDLPGKPHLVTFTVVVDAEPVSAIEDIYSDLACKTSSTAALPSRQTNIHQSIRDSLRRLCLQKDKSGNTCYYDEIKVIPASVFLNNLM